MDIQDQFAQSASTGDDAFRLLIESAIDTAILTLDREGRLTSWSTGAQRIMGYRESEILGQMGQILFLPEDRAAGVPEREMQTALEQGRADDQRWHLRQDGSCFFASGAMTPLRDEAGVVVGFTKVMRDETARKRAEDALRESEARFRTLFNQTTAGMVQAELSGRNILVNDQLCHILGYSRDELLQMRLHDITHSDDLSDCAAKFDLLVSNGTPFEMEKRYRRKNGSYAWISATIAAVCDADGKPQSVCAVIVDVSARKQIEADLHISEERYRTLFNSMNEGFCVIEMLFDADEKPIDCRFLEANAAFERQTGLNQVIGQRMLALSPRIDPHWFEIYGQVALSSQPIRFDNIEMVRGRWYEVQAYPYGTRENRQVAVIFNDITERRNAEVALRSSEERFRLATESAAMYAWEVDLLTGTQTFTENAMQVLGYDWLPLTVEEGRDFIHPDDFDKLAAAVQTAIDGSGALELEYRLNDPRGHINWVESHAVVRRDANGRPVRLLGISQNITERKGAEAQLRQSEERYRIALEAAEMGTWDWNVETGRMAWDAYYYTFWV